MGFVERRFKIDENQKIWETYYNGIINEWIAKNKEELEKNTWTEEEKELYSKKVFGDLSPKSITPFKYEYKRKRMSVQQYKPVALEFEEFIGKSFNEITAIDIEEFTRITTKSNKLKHLNAFMIGCVDAGIIKNKDKGFLISLLPETYRKVGSKIAEQRSENSNSMEIGMMKCVFCGKSKEAIASNWVLIQKGDSVEKYLACRECGGKDGKYRY